MGIYAIAQFMTPSTTEKATAKSRSEKRPPLNVETAGNSLS
jgi:hypothetical protein